MEEVFVSPDEAAAIAREIFRQASDAMDLDKLLQRVEAESKETLAGMAAIIVGHRDTAIVKGKMRLKGPIRRKPIEFPHALPDGATGKQKLAARALVWLRQLGDAMRSGDVRAVATYALKLGATAEKSLFIDIVGAGSRSIKGGNKGRANRKAKLNVEWDEWERLVKEKMNAGLQPQTACKQVAKQLGMRKSGWVAVRNRMKIRGVIK